MVTSPSGAASRWLAAALALFALCAGGAWYLLSSADETGPAPAASATESSPQPAAPPATAATAVERSEAPAPDRPAAPLPEDRGAAPAVPAVEAAVRVHGRVVDVRGAGIADARVAVLDQQPLPASIALGLPREVREAGRDAVQTDREGRFVVPLAERGRFELIASHDAHPSTRHAGVADGPRVDGVTIVLPDGGSIAGVVEGAPADAGELEVTARRVEEGVAAVAGAAASAVFDFGGIVDGLDLPIGARKAAVAADGTFRLSGLEPGARFSVFALRKVQEGQWSRCTERADVRVEAHGVVLRWRETLGIVARVVDAETGKPIEDLDVSVGPVGKMVVLGLSMPVPMRQPVPQRHFDGGVVQIDGIGVDDGKNALSIELRARGRHTWTRDDLDATRRGRIDLGVVQLVAAPVVRVTVVCGDEPVAGVTVRLDQVGDAPADERAGGSGGSFTFSTTTRTADSGVDSTAAVRSGTHVHDTYTAVDKKLLTDANGVCELTADFAGKARVVVESSRHAPFHGEPFLLPSRGVVEQRAPLWRGGTAIVRVVDGHGGPLANATVRRTGVDPGDTGTAKTDAQAAATLERLAPGIHSFSLEEAAASASGIRISISGVETRSDAGVQRVEIREGQVTEVLLTAPLRGSLRGVITLDGQPLDRAAVAVVDAVPDTAAAGLSAEVGAAVESMLGGLTGADQSLRTKTGVDGDYEIANVRAGPRRVVVTHKSLAMPACSDVAIVEGRNLHDIALRSTILRGRVLDASGEPVAGALVAVSIDVADANASTADVEQAAGVLGELFGGSLQQGVRTAADGTFELGGVRPGVPLRVRASSRLHVADSVSVAALPAGGSRDGVELRLGVAGRVRVRAAVEGAMSVKAEWAGPTPAPKGAGSARIAVLKSGRATLEGLPPGQWKLVLEGPKQLDARQAERTVEVTAGQWASVEF